MRSSISAQSCDSVPPAPGCMETIALAASCSPPSIFLVSAASTCSSSESSALARSAVTSSPLCAHSSRTPMSSIFLARLSRSSRSSASRRCRCRVFCASAWLSQKFGAATLCSSWASSPGSWALSKIAPHIGCALEQIGRSPDQVIENNGQNMLLLAPWLGARDESFVDGRVCVGGRRFAGVAIDRHEDDVAGRLEAGTLTLLAVGVIQLQVFPHEVDPHRQ